MTVGSQRLGERGVGRAEGIVGADVDPDRGAAVGVSDSGGRDNIVAGEVLGVVERAGSTVAAADPQRGGVPADRAETPGMQAGDVQRAEAAHRDTADGDPFRVGVQPAQRLRDHLVDDEGAPGSVGSVMPVGVGTAVGEDDVGCARAEPCEGREHRVVEV